MWWLYKQARGKLKKNVNIHFFTNLNIIVKLTLWNFSHRHVCLCGLFYSANIHFKSPPHRRGVHYPALLTLLCRLTSHPKSHDEQTIEMCLLACSPVHSAITWVTPHLEMLPLRPDYWPHSLELVSIAAWSRACYSRPAWVSQFQVSMRIMFVHHGILGCLLYIIIMSLANNVSHCTTLYFSP